MFSFDKSIPNFAHNKLNALPQHKTNVTLRRILFTELLLNIAEERAEAVVTVIISSNAMPHLS